MDLKNGFAGYNYRTGQASTYSLLDALARIHDLHLRATKQSPVIALDKEIPTFNARALYRSSLALLLTSIASSEDRATLERQILIAVEGLGETSGLISVLASFALSADNSEVVDHVYALLRDLPNDGQGGAGHVFDIAYDFANDELHRVDAKDLLSYTKEVNHLNTWREKLALRLNSLVMTNQQCKGWVTAAGIAVGASFGARVGGKAGAVIGASTGKDAGEAVGSALCPADKPEKKEEPGEQDNAGDGKHADDPNGGDGDDVPDFDPDMPPETDDDEGCIVNPKYDFRVPDPYARFALRSQVLSIPRGQALLAYFLVSKNRLQFDISGLKADLNKHYDAVARDAMKGKLGNLGRIDVTKVHP